MSDGIFSLIFYDGSGHFYNINIFYFISMEQEWKIKKSHVCPPKSGMYNTQ